MEHCLYELNDQKKLHLNRRRQRQEKKYWDVESEINSLNRELLTLLQVEENNFEEENIENKKILLVTNELLSNYKYSELRALFSNFGFELDKNPKLELREEVSKILRFFMNNISLIYLQLSVKNYVQKNIGLLSI